MKLQLVFLPLVLVWVTVTGLSAQSTNNDTVAYSAGFYTVPAGQKTVFDVAKNQQVDPKIVVEMNGFHDVSQSLTAGQKIKIPVYLHGYKYIVTDADLNGGKTPGKKDKGHVKNKMAADEAYSYELQKNKLLLIDATLELNETLLQGIKASLDSLKNSDKNLIDEKNISVTLRRMQRARDKALLTPYLFHFRDSLADNISQLVVEKSAIQSRLSNYQLQQVKVKDNTKEKAPLADIDEDAAREHMGNDLSPEGNLPLEPKRAPAVTREVKVIKHAQVHADSAAAPVASAVAPDTQASAHMHWEPAKALDPTTDNAHSVEPALDSLYKQANPDLTVIELAGKSGNVDDTLAYVPLSNKDATTKEEKDSSLLPVLDSINRLKAAVYLTRAQKALHEKNYSSGESLLKKAIDANPNYYDAWFLLAGLHVNQDLMSKGLNEYKVCQRLNPRDPALYYKIANAQFRQGKKDAALESYGQALKLDTGYLPAILGSASILMQHGQYSAAIAKCTHVLDANRTYHAAYKLRGVAEYLDKQYPAAIDDFTRYLLFDETDPFVYYYRGITKIVSKDRDAGCFDLSTSAQLGYDAALKSMQHNCPAVK